MYRSEMTTTKTLSTEGLRSKRRSGKKKKNLSWLKLLERVLYQKRLLTQSYFLLFVFYYEEIFLFLVKAFVQRSHNRKCSFFLLLIVGAAYQITSFKPLTPLLSFLDRCVGHEFPFAIKMNHMREAALTDEDGFPFDFDQQLPSMDPLSPETQCQFILKRNKKIPNRIAIGEVLSFSWQE